MTFEELTKKLGVETTNHCLRAITPYPTKEKANFAPLK